MNTTTNDPSSSPCQGHDFTADDTAIAWGLKREFYWAAFKALEFNGIEGDYVEFGSHGGMTFRLAHEQIRRRRPRRHLWTFDSFRGLPEAETGRDAHPQWNAGAMATALDRFHAICAEAGIARSEYSVVEGFYSETLRGTESARPANIALAYIDCDLYSSTREVLAFLGPRLKHGMILAFDDYYCWSRDELAGERRAFLEWVATLPQWHFDRYREIGWAGAAFVVERVDPVIETWQRSRA